MYSSSMIVETFERKINIISYSSSSIHAPPPVIHLREKLTNVSQNSILWSCSISDISSLSCLSSIIRFLCKPACLAACSLFSRWCFMMLSFSSSNSASRIF